MKKIIFTLAVFALFGMGCSTKQATEQTTITDPISITELRESTCYRLKDGLIVDAFGIFIPKVTTVDCLTIQWKKEDLTGTAYVSSSSSTDEMLQAIKKSVLEQEAFEAPFQAQALKEQSLKDNLQKAINQ